jgi:hypothetical protein
MRVFLVFFWTGVCSALDHQTTCNTSENSSQDYEILYSYLTGTGAHNFSESVTIGFLGAYGQAQVLLGALPLAVEAVNEDAGR